MALKKPLVLDTAGHVRQIASDETLDATLSNPEVITLTNSDATSMVIGNAAYAFGADAVKKARANAIGTAYVVALTKDASISSAASGSYQTDQILTATTGEWDAVTGDSGGLTTGSVYYLSATTAGGLTKTAPTAAGQYVVQVGIAISTTELLLKFQPPIGL